MVKSINTNKQANTETFDTYIVRVVSIVLVQFSFVLIEWE